MTRTAWAALALALSVNGVVFATLYQSAAYAIGSDGHPLLNACTPKAGAPTKVTVTATSAATTLTPYRAHYYHCTQNTYVQWGDGAVPTADSNSFLLRADTYHYFGTGNGSGKADNVAFVRESVDGTCKILECQ